MKISLNWLKEYVNLPPEVTPQQLAEKLTFAGLEVEAVTSLAKGFDKVVVGQILERKQHPNADRLSLTVIDVGGKEKLEIVCGAQNIKAGQKIPVAMVGAVIPNGLEIKPAKIRNVPSQGMLCSLDELLLPKEWQKEDGIFLLKEDAKLGTPMAEYLGLNDTILEISVTPNRGDALSHFGVARDVAALFGVTAKLPEPKVAEKAGGLSVKVESLVPADVCPAYHGRLVEGVKIGPSPEWLRKKLESVGLRSINNVVDVTAFVMLEMGQPLHAFDAQKLGAKDIQVSVREAKKGEVFHTLSDKKVELLEGDLLIAAGAERKGVALAGVMGGQNSEVGDGTTSIFLESAEFHPVRVRKTGRRLNLLTDAGYRFERGVDSGRIAWALDRATDLVVQVAGGTARKAVSLPEAKEVPVQLRVSLADIEKTLGKSPDQQKVIQIFRGLGISAEMAAGEQGVVRVTVPRWRKDIKRTIDLVEEVARIWGYENVQSELPLGGLSASETKDSRRRSYFQVRRVRRHLASLGFFEALNYGFTSPEQLAKVHSPEELARVVAVANPVTTDFSVMKPSLVGGLLENLRFNFAHRHKDLRLFELRRIFHKSEKPGSDAKIDTGVDEKIQLALVVTGAEVDEFWQGKPQGVDFYSLKGAMESIFEMLGIGGMQFEAGTKLSFLHPGQSASIVQGKKEVGAIGRLHPAVEKNFELDQDVFFAQLDLDALVSDERSHRSFKMFSNFPLVERDFSAEVSEAVTAQMIRNLVTKVSRPLIKDFHFFDVYKGSRITAGNVSYAFRVVLGADDHTLTDAEISSVQEKIMSELQKEYKVKFAGL